MVIRGVSFTQANKRGIHLTNGDVEDPKDDQKDNLPVWIGAGLSAVWVMVAAFYWAQSGKSILLLDLNEFGDFCAGIAAPLAFCWLVVAVFMQRRELELQRKELKESRKAQQLQAEETAALVEQNTASVKVAQASFDEQRRQEGEQRIDALIDLVAKRIVLITPVTRIVKENRTGEVSAFGNAAKGADADSVIAEARRWLMKETEYLGDRDFPPKGAEMAREIRALIRAVSAVLDALGTGDYPLVKARAEMLGIAEVYDALSELDSWFVRRSY
jgi:hypothetical protein